MHNERFFDQTLSLIEQGQITTALPMLAGKLFSAQIDTLAWPETRQSLLRHPLHSVLMEDPYLAHCYAKPRGYPGDAALIDILYDQTLPESASKRAADLFNVTTAFPAAQAVRLRREYAQTLVTNAWQAGKRICVLACGHFREGDSLIGHDLSNIVAIDQDGLSLDIVRQNHGDTITAIEANVFSYLRSAASRGEKFELIYTLGLTDYLDERAMRFLHKLMKACLAPSGTILLANFLPYHIGTGWMDAVMDWQLIYRDEAELAAFAREIGLSSKTWTDPTGCIAWCEMKDGQPAS
jgi:extracellular factor (EF) 3-hydroxypalmitic acid methyl ester biosynthesis protein